MVGIEGKLFQVYSVVIVKRVKVIHILPHYLFMKACRDGNIEKVIEMLNKTPEVAMISESKTCLEVAVECRKE